VEKFQTTEAGGGLQLAEDNQEGADVLNMLDLTNDNDLTSEVVESVKALWADPAIQAAYERRNEFQVRGLSSARMCRVVSCRVCRLALW
jgi:hypothetical protein